MSGLERIDKLMGFRITNCTTDSAMSGVAHVEHLRGKWALIIVIKFFFSITRVEDMLPSQIPNSLVQTSTAPCHDLRMPCWSFGSLQRLTP